MSLLITLDPTIISNFTLNLMKQSSPRKLLNTGIKDHIPYQRKLKNIVGKGEKMTVNESLKHISKRPNLFIIDEVIISNQGINYNQVKLLIEE